MAAGQQSQDKGPLTLAQIEALLQGRVQGEGASRTNRILDTVIAGEIQERGVAFRVDENILEHLHKLGAGVETIQALRLGAQAEKPLAVATLSGKITILVADFKSLNEQNYGVTEILLQQLRDATKEYADVEVKALNSSITAQQGSANAVARGSQYKASIVLWGWYTATRERVLVHVHCEFLQKPKNLVVLKDGQTILPPISQLDSFDFQIRLAGEMTYLTLLTVGLARLEAEDYDGAVARFTAALNQPPVPESMINPADVYYFRGVATFLKQLIAGKIKTADGIADFDKAIEIDPQRAKAQLFRGTIFLLNEQYDKAITDFSQVIAREPENGLAYLFRAFAYKQRGEERLASADLIRAMRMLGNSEGDPAAAQVLRAYGYFLSRDFDKALAELDQVIRSEPDNTVYLLMFRAVIYGVKENYDAALLDLNRAITMNASLHLLYVVRGAVYDEKGDHDRAIEDYSKAIELNPGDASIYVARARAYESKNDLDRAIGDYSKAIILDGGKAETYISRAEVFGRKNLPDRAIDDYNQAIKVDPHSELARFKRSVASHQYLVRGLDAKHDGELAEAIRNFDFAIKFNPESSLAYDFRGSVRQELGEVDLAFQDYDKAIELEPKNPTVFSSRAMGHERRNDLALAIKDYNSAIILAPSDPELYLKRASAYDRHGMIDEAVLDYECVTKIKPNFRLAKHERDFAGLDHLSKGLGHKMKGDFDQAISEYGKSIKLRPNAPETYLYRAEIFALKNENVRAAEDLKMVIQFASDAAMRKKAEDLLTQIESKGQQPGMNPAPQWLRPPTRSWMKVPARSDISEADIAAA